MFETKFRLLRQQRESWGRKMMGKRNGDGRDDGGLRVSGRCSLVELFPIVPQSSRWTDSVIVWKAVVENEVGDNCKTNGKSGLGNN